MNNRPKLRFKEFNDSIIECRIENILKIKHGKDQKAIECQDGIYPILATSGEIGRTNTYIWDKPCVLIGRKGTINKPQYMDKPFWTVDTLFYSDVNLSNCAKYIYYLFNTINWKKYDESTGVPSLSAKTIERIKVVITNNKNEQAKIAEFLSKVDEVITEREAEVKDLEQKKKGLMQKLFSQQLRFTDSNNNPYPDWKEVNIEDVCSIATGKGNTQDKEEDGIYPFYVRSPIVEKSNKYVYDGEAVLTVGDGVGTGKVFHYVNGKFNFHQRVYKMSEFKQVLGKYFYYYFSYNFYNRVRKMTAKTSVDSVRLEMISKMPIQIPCNEEQQKIAVTLSKMDELIEEKKALLSDWQQLKKGLLQQMFV